MEYAGNIINVINKVSIKNFFMVNILKFFLCYNYITRKKENQFVKKIIFGKRIVTSIYNTGIVLRALSSQTFSEMGFEITPEQYLILDLIIENGALYQRQIAEITLKDRGNVARIIKILEEKNLITKSQATQRRRIYKISVTEKGRELRDKMKPVTENLRRTFAKDVSEEELTITLNTLKKVYGNARGLVKLQI